MPKYCNNCGTRLTGKYCTECGKRAISDVEEEKRKLQAAKKEYINRVYEKTHRLIDLQADAAAFDFAGLLVDYSIGNEMSFFPGKTEMVLDLANWISCALRAAVDIKPPQIREAYRRIKESLGPF